MMMIRLLFEMMKYYSGDPHQIQHFTKVHSYARFIGLGEQLDDKTQYILEIAAIVHDIGIEPAIKKHGSASGKYQELEGPAAAAALLKRLQYPKDVIDRVCYLVGHHHTYKDIDGMDYQILVEADFLVNMFENEMGAQSVKSIFERIFRTKTGIEYCKVMYSIIQ